MNQCRGLGTFGRLIGVKFPPLRSASNHPPIDRHTARCRAASHSNSLFAQWVFSILPNNPSTTSQPLVDIIPPPSSPSHPKTRLDLNAFPPPSPLVPRHPSLVDSNPRPTKEKKTGGKKEEKEIAYYHFHLGRSSRILQRPLSLDYIEVFTFVYQNRPTFVRNSLASSPYRFPDTRKSQSSQPSLLSTPRSRTSPEILHQPLWPQWLSEPSLFAGKPPACLLLSSAAWTRD